MPEEEVKEGENDFSLIESGRLGRQWLMLGPLAFVNASCKYLLMTQNRKLLISSSKMRDYFGRKCEQSDHF